MARYWHQEHDDAVHVYADVPGEPLQSCSLFGGGQLKIGYCSRDCTKCDEERRGLLEGPDELLGSVKNTQRQGWSSQGSVRGEGWKGMPLVGEGSASEPPGGTGNPRGWSTWKSFLGLRKEIRCQGPLTSQTRLLSHCRQRTGPRHPASHQLRGLPALRCYPALPSQERWSLPWFLRPVASSAPPAAG